MIGTESEEDELRRLEGQLSDEEWIDRTPSVVTLDIRARVVALKKAIAARTPQPVVEHGNLPPPWVGLWQPLPLYDGAAPSEPSGQPDEPPQPTGPRASSALSPPSRAELSDQLFELCSHPYYFDTSRFRVLVAAAGDDVPTLRLLAAAGLRAGWRLAAELDTKLVELGGQRRSFDRIAPTLTGVRAFSDATELPDLHDGLTTSQRHLLQTMRLIAPAGAPPVKTSLVIDEALRAAPSQRDVLERAVVELGHPLLRRLPLIEGMVSARRIPEQTTIDPIRLAPVAEELLSGDLALPLLLINGASGATTAFPPWNPTEVMDDALWFLRNQGPIPNQYLRAQRPDFPVEGLDLSGEAYQVRRFGHGRLVLQGQTQVELDHAHRRARLVVTSLPWPLRVPQVIARVHELKLDGVVDVHDESTTDAARFFIDLEHAAFRWAVDRALTASGVLSVAFDARMRALVDGEPRTVSIDEALECFVADLLATERRRVEAHHRENQQRIEHAEAVVVALMFAQPILAALRNTDDNEQAVPLLMNLMTPPLRAQLESLGELSHDWARGFTEPQARHVLSVRKLWSRPRAAALREWEALKDELAGVTVDEAQVRRAVMEKLGRSRERFGSPRRTRVR